MAAIDGRLGRIGGFGGARLSLGQCACSPGEKAQHCMSPVLPKPTSRHVRYSVAIGVRADIEQASLRPPLLHTGIASSVRNYVGNLVTANLQFA